MRNIYERVLGPLLAKKHEYVYSDGYPVRQDKPIWAVYLKRDKIEMFVDVDEVPVFARNPKDKTLFGRYKSAKSNLQREIYLKPYMHIMTDAKRKSGSISRAFATYMFNKDKSIFEIDPAQSSIASFYKTVKINWIVSGIKEQVRKTNQESLEVANETLEGMRFLLDPLEFYDVVEETDYSIAIQEKLSRLKHY